MSFNIATALSKKAKRWKNQTISWADFLDRLRSPYRTAETVAEYRAMSKMERDQRKEAAGGFVGGYLIDGIRKRGRVKYRSMVCLDADNIPKGTDILRCCREAFPDTIWAAYTTHSHTAEKPRYRFIFPLDPMLEPERYEPLARMIASKIGIEFFDPTTYEAVRLMYWPSVCRDGEYVFDHNDEGVLLDGDLMLAEEYEDWSDSSAWPMSQQEAAIHQRELKKLGDPREKKNIVGAFCRAYSIEEAMAKYLPGVYAPCEVENRYTYTAGTTTGGVVIYDGGLYAYSHHATDPISGQDVNAFDLVRLNLFHELDEECRDDTGPTKLPSYQKMVELALKDDRVKVELANNFSIDSNDFDDSLITSDDKKAEWKSRLQFNDKGQLSRVAENFLLIIANDEGLKDAFGLDDFSHRVLLKRSLPWRKRADGDDVWRDSDDAQLRNYLSRKWNGISNRALTDDAWQEVCQRNRFHQVRDWMESLSWDGVKRADSLLIDFLGAEDTEYVRTLTKLFFKAAVARVVRPGTKFDNCLVLTGPQGIGKSTVLAAMGGKWFNDSIVSLQGKDVLEQLQGSLVVELAEMQAANRAENDMIKAFISRQVDKFRAPYGRRTEEYRRQCVFAATTNEDIFLKDRTGGRRFWIIATPGGGTKSLSELTPDFVAQVWAELWQAYKDDRSLLPTKSVLEALRSEQESRTEGDEKKGIIQGYLDTPIPTGWKNWSLKERQGYFRGDVPAVDGDELVQRDRVCVLEIWCECFGSTRERMKNMDARELNTIMQRMPGWVRYDGSTNGKIRFDDLYGIQRAFVRMSSKEEQYSVAKNVADYDELI